MEPDMACCIIQKMEDKGHEIGTLHADNDTTTQSRLPSTIIKKNDKSHVKKNLASSLYSLSKKHKQLKSTGVIPYIVRCFMYTISKHQGFKETLGAELATVVPHIFGDHNQCSSSWCTYNKDPTKFRYKHLPDGKALSGDHLKEDLEKLAKSYIDRADRLMNLGSTQANESFNNSVASFAPKNRFYGGTKSLKARISSAVMLKNEGSGWLSKVNENILLSPGQMTKLHGLRRDKIRKRVRDMKRTVAFKRKRISLKNKNVRCDRREAVKEGDTYGNEIELQEDADIETILSKIKLSGEETVVVFDLETTGLPRRSDITQLAAFDGEELFNSYIIPSHNISPTVSSLTGLSFDFHTNQMYHHGTPVKSEDLYTAMRDFIDYINKKQKPILFGHNIAAYMMFLFC
ncbi:uncharacterized protein LOC134246768 [Saccostrea cucullata]|uniref:uncharacterized protein LOC134246768 n=1 Tax=Saccostrea cuccullata TaxID=36930 RepID=UPI002ED6A74E